LAAIGQIHHLAKYHYDQDIFVLSLDLLHISGQNQLLLGKTFRLYPPYANLVLLGATGGDREIKVDMDRRFKLSIK
jgi:hypothetical protein